MDPTLIAALLGVFGTVSAAVVGFLTARAKAPAANREASAVAAKAGAEAAHLIIRDLREQYEEVSERVAEQTAEIAELRKQVRALTRRIAAFERIVKGLPSEIQARFAEVMTTSSHDELNGRSLD